MLLGLMSRWITPRLWAWSAGQIWRTIRWPAPPHRAAVEQLEQRLAPSAPSPRSSSPWMPLSITDAQLMLQPGHGLGFELKRLTKVGSAAAQAWKTDRHLAAELDAFAAVHRTAAGGRSMTR
jgi:hypothetical protein